MFPLIAANDQRPDSAETIKSTFYRPESPSPWGFGVSGSLVLLLPAEKFYEGFHSAPGAHFSLFAFQRDLDGRTNGFTFCVSFQFAKLSRDVEKTSSVGFFGIPQFETSLSITSTQIALELGRAFPFGSSNSNFFAALGLAIMTHSGSGTNQYSYFGYEEGSLPAVRVKCGVAVALSQDVSIVFHAGFDALRARVTYANFSNYSETKTYGVLAALGLGCAYTL
jgi:hypothetical protein